MTLRIVPAMRRPYEGPGGTLASCCDTAVHDAAAEPVTSCGESPGRSGRLGLPPGARSLIPGSRKVVWCITLAHAITQAGR